MSSGSGTGHGGNIHLLERQKKGGGSILDFSANINPLGPPSWFRSCISSELESLVHYPDPDCYSFVQEIAGYQNVDPRRVIAANGTTEVLYLLPHILKCRRAIIPVPSYIDYQRVFIQNEIEVVQVQLLKENNFELDFDLIEAEISPGDVVIIGTPNNPTATIVDPKKISELANKYKDSWFVIDEAFLDFIDNKASASKIDQNIITLNSLTKFYALPGLRLGFSVFPSSIADKARKVLPPWTVNTLAQKVGSKIFSDHDYRKRTLRYLKKVRADFFEKLSLFQDIKVYPSRVNYFLIEILGEKNVDEISSAFIENNIAIRNCSNYDGLNNKFFRIAVRTEDENNIFIQTLERIFPQKRTSIPKINAKKPALMIQGTSSNAGKSVLVAAFCRIFIQDGLRVAPFKAQNMSLNSFVTRDDFEMGRAQVVQAQAAKLDPDVRMNPVLLKPNSDMGSQIIVNGKAVANMSVKQYVQYKDEAGEEARKSYDSLSSEYDCMLLEGAGSPGEVNLKHHDIVNMQMARYAKSPVLLVGDIDRGGVYASFIGTMEVLEEWERDLVAGFLVNRFRGDSSLLQDAHDFVLNHTKKEVFGTIPYITDLGIPEEDSVSFKSGQLQKKRPDNDHVELALINLPHISNFTDIEPFLEESDVFLNIVDTPQELGDPDAIIIPGSKNVVHDMMYLQETGLDNIIKNKADKNTEIVGICGGYQILGKTISDPHGIETDLGEIKGLGLLDISTTLAKEKTLVRKEGTHRKSNKLVYGYEIHHGLSHGNLPPTLSFNDGSVCGAQHGSLPIWGSYLHGIFDSDSYRRFFINELRKKKGLEITSEVTTIYNLERAFDNLANIVRSSVDMDKIYKLLHL